MAFTKHASLEGAQVLELKSSRTKVRQASLGKLADFHHYRTEDGYLYARIRAISSRVNKNYDGWPSIELAGGPEPFEQHRTASDGFTIVADARSEYGFSTFNGKPIFVDHHNSDPSRARGAIVDALLHVEDHKTSAADAYYSSSDVDPEHLPGTWVELLLEVDAKAFPKFAKAIVEGSRNPKKGIDGWSMGCDVEKSVCSICKNAASQPDDYCNHIKLKGAYFDTVDPRTGHRTSKRAYENCYGVKFFEISGVFDPADETALSREVRSKTQEETITQDPKEEGLKDLADDLNEELLAASGAEHLKRKKKNSRLACPNCQGHSGTDCPMCNGHGHLASGDDSDMAGGARYDGQWECPNCGYSKYHERQDFQDGAPGDHTKVCADCGKADLSPPPSFQIGNDGSTYPPLGPNSVNVPPTSHPVRDFGPVHQGGLLEQWRRPQDDRCGECNGHGTIPGTMGESLCPKCEGTGKETTEPAVSQAPATSPYHPRMVAASTRIAENPLPQSEMSRGPEPVDTLRAEEICPVCGSSMDDDTCAVCGYEEPPEGFGNPDLTKAQDVDVSDAAGPGVDDHPSPPPEGSQQPEPDHGAVNTPTNPTALAHVTSDMDWNVHSKTAARINKTERPLINSDKPQTNEPVETIISDQSQPVTSRVRTARDFIAAAGATRGNPMNHTAEAASGAPAVAKPDVRTDVTGIGGVDQASNDAASKADAQVDVTGIGGVGVESVGAEQEGVNVEQGDEHSKNIEAIPTKTWHGDKRQHAPVTTEPFPASADGVHASSWVVESYDDSAFPGDEIEGGSAVRGVQPIAESFGDRVDVLDHVTSPANNSGPTTTWTGTDGNGVNKQQDPVTPESIARGESEMEGAPNWTSSTHIFTAFKLADLEIDLGLISADTRYARAAQLERETPATLAASLQYAQRVKKAAVHRTAGVNKLPAMARSTVAKEAAVEAPSTDDDSFMFGGL